MRRILLIGNPTAARTRARTFSAVAEVLRGEGCEVTVAETAGPQEAREAARAASRNGIDAVAVYGGDGTVMQAVAGVLGRDVPIGLIPGGTGNLLAGNLRLPRNPLRAAKVVAHGVPRSMDLGCLEENGRTHYFAVACGCGIDADLMHGTSSTAKRRWGFAAYVARTISILRTARPLPYRITVDGVRHDVEATALIVANCREFIPPVVRLAPDINWDDGQLDVVLLRARGYLQAGWVILKLLRGVVDGRWVRRLRGREIQIEAAEPRPLQWDGEAGGTTPFTTRILPGALSVLVPPS